MKNNKINYKNFFQKKYLDSSLNKKLIKKYNTILKGTTNDYRFSNGTLQFLNRNFRLNLKFAELKRFKKFNTVVIIGMGGSILGAEAIYGFLKEKIKKNFIFVNDINFEKIKEIKKKLKLQKTLFIVISKSGNTIETLSNLLVFKILKKNAKNLILVSEKSDNPFYNLSKKMSLQFVEHRKLIGGRYSVLSEVGMLPAYFMGTNLNSFRKNLYRNKSFLRDSVIKLTNIFLKKSFKNIIFLNYVPQLEKFLFWNQQLMAESLGKNNKGLLPLVSNVPKDHHSLLQLYLDGPKDKIFYIFSLDKNEGDKLKVKNLKKMKFLNNKNLNQIKQAQKNAMIQTFKEESIPFREFSIKNLNEQSLGELFSYFILETVLIGRLSNINPFNQPAVEKVKIKTRKILS